MSNSGFTKVSALAENLRDLNVSTAKVSNLTANSVVSRQGKLVRKTVVGYSPTTFSTAASTTVLTLNTSPGLGVATASTALLLPQQCIVESVEVVNGGTTITSSGSPTFTIHTSSTLGGASVVALVTAATMANVNKAFGAYVTLTTSAAGAPTPAAVEATTAYVSVLVNTADVTAGNLAVYITYLAVE